MVAFLPRCLLVVNKAVPTPVEAHSDGATVLVRSVQTERIALQYQVQICHHSDTSFRWVSDGRQMPPRLPIPPIGIAASSLPPSRLDAHAQPTHPLWPAGTHRERAHSGNILEKGEHKIKIKIK